MAGRAILGVFAHPDDETSGCAGTFRRYAAEGVRVTVVTATRGEEGTLGTDGQSIPREELGKVREREQREVARLLGVREVVYLDYVDKQVKDAPHQQLVDRVLGVMDRVQPDIAITFGPLGISRHDDHIAVSRAASEAFHIHNQRRGGGTLASLYYAAIPKEIIAQFGMELDGVETQPTTVIDIGAHRALKVQALRTYRSQEDAQEFAKFLEEQPEAFEWFHQVYPPVADGPMRTGFW